MWLRSASWPIKLMYRIKTELTSSCTIHRGFVSFPNGRGWRQHHRLEERLWLQQLEQRMRWRISFWIFSYRLTLSARERNWKWCFWINLSAVLYFSSYAILTANFLVSNSSCSSIDCVKIIRVFLFIYFI